jgi:hypothetical protein
VSRRLLLPLAALIVFRFDLLFAAEPGKTRHISLNADSKNTLLITIEQRMSGKNAHSTRVRIRIPRGLTVIPTPKFISYHLFTQYDRGDTSRLDNPPEFGFLIFANDLRGSVLEVHLVEFYDKHDYIPDEINGVYRIGWP